MNIILFDGLCNFCNGFVQVLIKHDSKDKLLFSAQQSNAGIILMNKHKLNSKKETVVFIKGDDIFFKSNAIIEIAKLVTGWPSIFKYTTIFPKKFRNLVYDFIAKYRYILFGKRSCCFIPSPWQIKKFV